MNSLPDKDLLRDLELINYPPSDWRKGIAPADDSIFDVVIIGAGMAGLTAGAALFKEGIFNIQLFDQSAPGIEGPWVTYARMKSLRSTKELMGPALEIPHLTFRAWFEVLHGAEAWQKLGKIPNALWMDYLNWYRQAMQLPVQNHCTLADIIPRSDHVELQLDHLGKSLQVKTRKVILATGRGGFGGAIIPHFAKQLPKSVYAHTIESINFNTLVNRRVGIIGVGASAFDAAAVALERGAKSVDLIMRRKTLANVNKFASTTYKGFSLGYFKLSDEKRLEFMQAGFEGGHTPPMEALMRIKGDPRLHLLSNTSISHIEYEGNEIQVKTNQGIFIYDYLILGTGFHINGYQQPELHHCIDHIALWKDRVPAEIMQAYSHMENFPYLGPSFEFLPKNSEIAPYLKNIYCFNYGATLSHGLLSSDIPAISIGATRLAHGIAADFFVQDSEAYLQRLKNYQEEEFQLDFISPSS
jgi:cation diffusion facilitator CzcD-associated flavoprotein CzcO